MNYTTPEYQREWRAKNREHTREYMREYMRNRRLADIERARKEGRETYARRMRAIRDDPEKNAEHLARKRLLARNRVGSDAEILTTSKKLLALSAGVHVSLIPQELVEVKVAQLRVSRLVREIKGG